METRTTPNHVDAHEVLHCLEAILTDALSDIKRSNREGQLLEYGVQAVLGNRTQGIVEPLTAPEALGRNELAAWLAQQSGKLISSAEDLASAQADLAQHAAKLRRKLKQYNERKALPYRIALPARGYVPLIERIERIRPKHYWRLLALLAVPLTLTSIGDSAASRDRHERINVDHAGDGAKVRHGTLGVGRELMYLLVLDRATYYVQRDDLGRWPLTFCEDGSWSRQVYPGTQEMGIGRMYRLVLVRTTAPLRRQSFPARDLPVDAVRVKEFDFQRGGPTTLDTIKIHCPGGQDRIDIDHANITELYYGARLCQFLSVNSPPTPAVGFRMRLPERRIRLCGDATGAPTQVWEQPGAATPSPGPVVLTAKR